MARSLASAVTVALAGMFAWAVDDAYAGNPTLKLELLPAYQECTAPNATVADSFPVTSAAACSPQVRSDPTCGFGPTGSGRVEITVSRRGLRVRARLAGLDAGCEGQTLTLHVAARASTAACSPGPCTIGDPDSAALFPARPCTVTNGACTMGGDLPKGDLPGSSIALTVFDVAVRRGATRTFGAGFRLPVGTRTP